MTNSPHRPRRRIDLRRARKVALYAALMVLSGQAWAEPQFADFPTPQVLGGRSMPPLLDTADAKMYRTQLRRGAAGPVNFGGHYSVILWGCGTECGTGAILDRRTGRSFFLPSVCCSKKDMEDGFEDIRFRLDSGLLVMTGLINDEGDDGDHYFLFDGERLSLISTTTFLPPPTQPATPSASDAPAATTLICKDIKDDLQRLACFDKQSGR